MPIVAETNLPLFIIQPEKSPWHWKLDETIPALQKGGSDVYVRKLNSVRDRFFFRPDATSYEKKLSKKLPVLLSQSIKLLKPFQNITRVAIKNEQPRPDVKIGKKDRVLQPYKGEPVPPLLKLENLDGKTWDLAFRGASIRPAF